ncbi:YihY/virulence factor BrkB family protein [Phytoactinopolyspora mesophila]|uniref:YihY family inner membrane protein n=1 Tax=Phytoactinopolyspora mesophila TaxID=2650750 RepID=A0A7K3M3V9_9ACTN|nr:YihY/virulence factor BrkB family protein [Phytoactinopolyspora mesophila]NDL58011.1 YihY family inner membrane protein [Phytoactinopolyspora mesophila]
MAEETPAKKAGPTDTEAPPESTPEPPSEPAAEDQGENLEPPSEPATEKQGPDLPRGFVLKRVVRGFSAHKGTDLAAALTYYAVLAVFPATIALASVPALVGQEADPTAAILDVVDDVAPALVEDLRGPIEQLAQVPAAGLGLLIGLLGALWVASGYVGAFGRSLNQIYGVEEGRPFWKLRPAMLLVTLATVVLVALAVVLLVMTGPLARAVGDAIGLGDVAVTVWDIAKWPVLIVVVLMVIALLYWATPNVRHPKFRLISAGALLALVVWAVASAGFGFYVANFADYDRTYGSLAGVVVFLLWLWITNIALLFGAAFDMERERVRELRAGIPAEERLQLPPRDTRKSDKTAAKAAQDAQSAREFREHQGRRDAD